MFIIFYVNDYDVVAIVLCLNMLQISTAFAECDNTEKRNAITCS